VEFIIKGWKPFLDHDGDILRLIERQLKTLDRLTATALLLPRAGDVDEDLEWVSDGSRSAECLAGTGHRLTRDRADFCGISEDMYDFS
jgi:hypothetical protein